MDRRKIELQIRVVLVTYRTEFRRSEPMELDGFRERAALLLDRCQAEAAGDPDLLSMVAAARVEVLG